jgi:outer membrane protein OmpA-like peptidoglycan-associated protein
MVHVVPAFVFAAALTGAGALMAQPGPRQSFIICPGHPRCPSQAAAPNSDPPAVERTRSFSLSQPSSRAIAARPGPARPAPAGPSRHETAATILFEANSVALNPPALLQLDQLSGLLASAPQVRIAIEGHAASSGPPTDHGAVAGQRVRAVADYLVSLGIDPGRMELISWGSSQPVTDETGTERDRLGRRVDIRAAD